jgi:hypothetical protein
MAEAGLFIGWGRVARGREDRALDAFNETLELYGRMQSDGRIESFEVCLLEPHGGDLGGFVLLRGSEAQMDAIHHDEEFLRLMQKANLIVDDLGIVNAFVGDGLQRAISRYREQLAVVA